MAEEKEITTSMSDADLALVIEEKVKAATSKIEKDFDDYKNTVAKNTTPEYLKPTNNIQVNLSQTKENKFGMLLKGLAAMHIQGITIEKYFESRGIENAMIMPEHIRQSVNQNKSLTIGSLSGGGALVNEMYYPDIIPLLTDQAVIRKADPRIIDMPNGNITMRVRTGGSTLYWVEEKGKFTSSQPTFGEIRLSAKKAQVQVPVSNELLNYASYNADAIISQSIIEDVALGEDATLLSTGTGSAATPRSLINWCVTNTAATAGTSAANITTDIKTCIGKLLSSKIPMQKPVWFMTPKCWNTLRFTVDSNSNLMFFARELQSTVTAQNPYGTLCGYPVFVTTVLDATGGATSTLLLADMMQTMLGQSTSMKIEFMYKGSYWDGTSYVSGNVTDESVYTCQLAEDFGVANELGISKITAVAWGA